jgi:TRAP-type C4-dicarboxylate transport system substrate-binding protein
LHEVQKYLVLTGHIITPRLVVANEEFLAKLSAADRAVLTEAVANAVKWQDAELARQEASLVDGLKGAGMTVIEPDLESFRKPVLAQLPPKFEDKWGKGTWDKLLAL